jgi:hypothetical protein
VVRSASVPVVLSVVPSGTCAPLEILIHARS